MQNTYRAAWVVYLFAALGMFACQTQSPVKIPVAATGKTGVLLVSHGSHSAQWRGMLKDVQTAVEQELLAHPGIHGVRTAFMEYNEPSIATGLKRFDDEGYDDVILVPLLLTVSSHSFDDIPTIYGAKEVASSREALRAEGIERYTPRARVTMTPLLDYTNMLATNIARRFAALSENPAEEGVVIVAYGSEPYNEEWEEAFSDLAEKVEARTGAGPVHYAWCGHIAHYEGKPTQDQIRAVLEVKQRALVIPALVARDEAFQDKIIGGAIAEMDLGERVRYRPDSVLPDQDLNDWIVEISHETADRISDSPLRSAQANR